VCNNCQKQSVIYYNPLNKTQLLGIILVNETFQAITSRQDDLVNAVNLSRLLIVDYSCREDTRSIGMDLDEEAKMYLSMNYAAVCFIMTGPVHIYQAKCKNPRFKHRIYDNWGEFLEELKRYPNNHIFQNNTCC
jgi:hypothetical protein